MNRTLLMAALGCGLLTGTASAQPAGFDAPPPMGMTAIPGGPGPEMVAGGAAGGCSDCGANAGYARHHARYGWNPIFRKLAFWKHDNACGTGGSGLLARLRAGFAGLAGTAGGCNGCGANGFGGPGGFGGQGGPAFNPYPGGVPGTLVFPNHWYARSPRDFFMMDGR